MIIKSLTAQPPLPCVYNTPLWEIVELNCSLVKDQAQESRGQNDVTGNVWIPYTSVHLPTPFIISSKIGYKYSNTVIT